MKIKTALPIVMFMGLLFVSVRGQGIADLPVREETTRRYELPANARVEVSSIMGSVEIEAVDGNAAEVYFVRSANARVDLERFDQINLKQSEARLVLRGADSKSNGVEVRHRVKLRLPRHCELRLQEINGSVSISGMAGALRLSEINGNVALSQVFGMLEMNSINGGITLALQRLTMNGMRIRDVCDLELRVANDLNAQLDITELDAAPLSEATRVSVRRVGENRFQERIGNGGPTIRLDDVKGKVKIRGV